MENESTKDTTGFCSINNYVSARYGILGGTFNPIHNGHIELAERALYQFELDGVLVMPNSRPAYKETTDEPSDIHRANMVKLAVQKRDGLIYSDFELERGGITYTADTLEQLHSLYPGIEWYFIMGGDSIMYFDKWSRPDVIARLAVIVVAERPGVSGAKMREKVKTLKAVYPYIDIRFEETDEYDVSSSDIRKRLKSGLDVSGMLPLNVIEYIEKNELYIRQEA